MKYHHNIPGLGMAIAAVLVLITVFSGWVNNIIWTFSQTDVSMVLLGILGALMFPIGALHGVYLWFV